MFDHNPTADDYPGHVCRMVTKTEVFDSIVDDAMASVEMAHVVLVSDAYLAQPLVFGPFADPFVAAAFVETYRVEVTYQGCESPPTMTVLPLLSTHS